MARRQVRGFGGYHVAMTDTTELRSGLIDSMRACRDDGAGDLRRARPGRPRRAGRRRRLVAQGQPRPPVGMAATARRPRWPRSTTDLPEPTLPGEGLDATNAIFHAERARWSWDVRSTPTPTRRSNALDRRDRGRRATTALTRADGPRPDHGRRPGARPRSPRADRDGAVGMTDRVRALADRTQAMLDRRRLAGPGGRLRSLQPRLILCGSRR